MRIYTVFRGIPQNSVTFGATEFRIKGSNKIFKPAWIGLSAHYICKNHFNAGNKRQFVCELLGHKKRNIVVFKAVEWLQQIIEKVCLGQINFSYLRTDSRK